MIVQEDSLSIDTQTASLDRNLLVEYLRRWGGSAANAVLDPCNKIFTTPGIEGVICYRDGTRCIITYGDPVCAPKDIPNLTTAFHRYCADLAKDIVYIGTLKSFTQWALNNICGTSIEFGVELTINPQQDPKKYEGSNGQLLRGKVRHALREGVTVQEFKGDDAILEKQIEDVATAWLAGRKGPQVYIADVNLFDDRYGKRWLYATMKGKVVGVVMLSLLKEHKGWLIDRLITNQAPNGTSELLVTTALDILRAEGCEFVTFGPSPAPKLGEIKGLGNTSTWLARKGYGLAYRFLNLAGRHKFWEKYHPQSEPCYLMFSRKGLGLSEISGLIHALNISF